MQDNTQETKKTDIKFETALKEAVEQFTKSPSKRSKKLSREVQFLLGEIIENWEHCCREEESGLGNRRYYWHGKKDPFNDNFFFSCSDQYLQDYFNEEFGIADFVE
jgi:hypothetical protein